MVIKVVEVDIKELYYVLFRKLWLILLIGILSASLAWAYSNYSVKPLYKSSTKVYVMNKEGDKNITLSVIESSYKISRDYMIIAKSCPVLEKVIQKLGLNITGKELSDLVQISSPLDTGLLLISVRYNDPFLAKQIADSIAEISIARMVFLMDCRAIYVVEKSNTPSTPITPDIKLNTVLGGILGIAIVTFLIMYIHVVYDSISTIEDIEKYLGLITLGVIPVEKSRAKKIRLTKVTNQIPTVEKAS